MILAFNKLLEKQNELRNRYRNPSSDRYRAYFIRRDESDTSVNKLTKLSDVLEDASKS